MGVSYSLKIVTDGLVLCLDAANERSYPGTGTIWNDLSGNDVNINLYNSPTWESSNLGFFNFDGADDYMTNTNPNMNLSTTQITIVTWYWGNTTQTASTFFKGANAAGGREFSTHLTWSDGNIYWDAGDNGAKNTAFDRIFKLSNGDHLGWNHWTFTKNSTDGTMNIYRNGQLWHNGTGLTQNIGSITALEIGGFEGKFIQDNGKLSSMQIYNKALTPQEVLQNYNATKGRFGL